MKKMTNLLLGAASLAGVIAVTAPSFAQDAPPWALSGAVTLTSDYRFRGISQGERNFAPQGSLTVTGPEGFYVSAWASQVDFTPGSSNAPEVELDIYGGKHTDLWGVDWNFMPYYYSYPSEPGGYNADYFELINQLTKAVGPATFTATWAWSDNLAFDGGTGNYLQGLASYTVLDWLSVSGHLGHQWAQNAKYVGSRDYTWGDIGVTATYQGFALDLRYVGTDLSSAQCGAFYMATNHACGGGVVASLTYSIALLP